MSYATCSLQSHTVRRYPFMIYNYVITLLKGSHAFENHQTIEAIKSDQNSDMYIGWNTFMQIPFTFVWKEEITQRLTT